MDGQAVGSVTHRLFVLFNCRLLRRHRPKMANDGRCIHCNQRALRR